MQGRQQFAGQQLGKVLEVVRDHKTNVSNALLLLRDIIVGQKVTRIVSERVSIVYLALVGFWLKCYA